VTSHGHAALRLAGSAPDEKLVDTLNALNARLNDLEAKARSTETDVATSRTRDSTPPENQPPRRSERATDGVDLSTDESVVLDGSAVSRAKSDIFSIRLIPDTAATRRLDPLRDSENAGGGRAFDPAPLPDAALNAAGVISGSTGASYTATTADSYTVTVSNANCSATSAVTVVNVNALPTATVSAAGATTFCSGGSVVLLTVTVYESAVVAV